jgi:hypothetical protein
MTGTNGIQDGQRNVETFLSWSSNVSDWKPFVSQGLLSVSRLAKECDLNRNVFYTNPELRDVHLPALVSRLEDDGFLRSRVANPVQLTRQKRGGAVSDARIKQIQEESEAVKAENRELRRQLERLKGIDEILHSTGRVPW